MATYTQAERKAWWLKMNSLAKQIGRMPADQQKAIADKIGTVTCEGHPLSMFNCCFLYQQTERPLAMVGGHNQWKRAGRIVRKGEHACGHIWVPLGKKNGDQETDDDRPRFRLIPVFDITQTEEQ